MRVEETVTNQGVEQSTVFTNAPAAHRTKGMGCQTTARKFSLNTLYTLTPPTPPVQSNKPAVVSFVQKWKYKCLGISAVCVVLLIVVIRLGFSSSRGHNEDAFSFCSTTACDTYAGMILSAVDKGHDPCINFYQYVCNGWRDQKSVYAVHVRSFVEEFAKTLKGHIPLQEQSATEKAAGFFQSCVTVATSERGELESFRGVFRQCGIEWPRVSKNPDVLRSLIKLQKLLAIENLLNIRLQSYGERSVNVFAGTTVNFYYDNSQIIKGFAKYRAYYEGFQNLFRTVDTKDEDFLNYDRFVEIESRIFNELLHRTSREYRWRVMNLSQLAQLTPGISHERWSQVLASELNVSTNTPIQVAEEDYLGSFSILLKAPGEVHLHHQVGWIAFQTLAPFMNRESLHIYGGDANDPAEVNLWKCLPLTEAYMGWAAYAKYFASKLDANTTIDITDIIGNIGVSTTAKVSVPSSAVDTGSSLPSDMLDMLWYHNKYDDRRLDAIFTNFSDMGPRLATNWYNFTRETGSKTNETAYLYQRAQFGVQIWESFTFTLYNSYHKVYLIPPNALILPSYDPGVTAAVKYGAFGSLLASAALGISRYPSQGIANRACVKEFFNGTRFGAMVLHSAASLQIAWDAYKNASHTQMDVRLRELSTVSANQLFFVASCYILCGQPAQLEPDRRCNEPLRHHPHFSRVFYCPAGSFMNPRNQCQLF